MSNAASKFTNQPTTLITEDAEAQAIMLELGVLDHVSRQTDPTDTISACMVDSHPTHWCICARLWNNPNPAENGFMVIAYPKDQVDGITVQLRLQAMLAGSTRVTVRPFGSVTN